MANCPKCFEVMNEAGVCSECGYDPEERNKIDQLKTSFEQSAKKLKLPLGDLRGPDGNALVIFGRVTGALKQLGVPRKEIDALLATCLRNNYEENLRMFSTMFELDISGYDDVDEFLEAYVLGFPEREGVFEGSSDAVHTALSEVFTAGVKKAVRDNER